MSSVTEKEGESIVLIEQLIHTLEIQKSLSTLKFSLDKVEKIVDSGGSLYLTKFAAELCFLLAKEYEGTGSAELALKYKNKSIEYYRACKIETLEDSVPILSKYLPDFMHEGVVSHSIKHS